MNKQFGPLSDDEVRQIALLIQTLEGSTFDYLQMELGDLKLTIGKGSPLPAAAGEASHAAPAAPAATPPAPAARAEALAAADPLPAARTEPAGPAGAAASPGRAVDGTVPIVAPIMGRFYSRPEPGAEPFVSVGSRVGPETTVCLIEVMKVFTSIRAEASGVITEVCVQDEQFIEYGQVLFRLRPA